MISISLAVIFIALCAKWGAWKRWREFYPTVLYMIVGNLAYFYVFDDYQLWRYSSFLGETYSGLIVNFIIYPLVTILYLTHYPEKKLKQVLYILAWTAVGTLVEVICLLTNSIYYEHGWNLLCSILLLAGTFILLRLHYNKPLIVWPVSLLCGIAVALIFGLPPPK